MLTIDDKNIKISKGDTFNILFQVSGYEFKDTDVVIFTIKKDTYSNEALIEKRFEDIQDNIINVIVTADEMSKLTTGEYVYDLVCKSGDTILTLNYPAKIRITGVVHNEL